jgi:hypothetical protein
VNDDTLFLVLHIILFSGQKLNHTVFKCCMFKGNVDAQHGSVMSLLGS